MYSLIAADHWLIARVFEPIAWRVEHKTGVNQYALARYVLAALIAGDVTAHVTLPQQNGSPVSYTGLMLGGVVLAAAVVHSRSSEAKAYQRMNNDHETAGGYWLRAVFTLLAAYMILSSMTSPKWEDRTYRLTVLCFTVGNAAYLVFLYFCACRMKPPEYGLKPREARIRT